MSTLKADVVQSSTGGATTLTDLYPTRAWVNWNQTGTVAILSDGGVSSITDNGTGLATVGFSSTKSDPNYGFNGSVNTYFLSNRWDVFCIERNLTLVRSTSSVPVNMGYGGYAERDFVRVTAVITE